MLFPYLPCKPIFKKQNCPLKISFLLKISNSQNAGLVLFKHTKYDAKIRSCSSKSLRLSRKLRDEAKCYITFTVRYNVASAMLWITPTNCLIPTGQPQTIDYLWKLLAIIYKKTGNSRESNNFWILSKYLHRSKQPFMFQTRFDYPAAMGYKSSFFMNIATPF